MSQGVLCQKIRFLGQKLWPVAREQTDTHTLSTLSSTYDISGPIIGKYVTQR